MGHSNIYKGNHGIVGVLIVSQSKQYDDIGTVRYGIPVRYRTAHKSKMTHGLIRILRSRTVQYLYRTGRQEFVIIHTVQCRIVRK